MKNFIKIIFSFFIFVVVGLKLNSIDRKDFLPSAERLAKSIGSSTSSFSTNVFLKPVKQKRPITSVITCQQLLLSTPEYKKLITSVSSEEEKSSSSAKKICRLINKNDCLARLVQRCQDFISEIELMSHRIKLSPSTDSFSNLQVFDILPSYDSDDEIFDIPSFQEYVSHNCESDCDSLLLDIELIKRDVVKVRQEFLDDSLLGSSLLLKNEAHVKKTVVREIDNISYAIELLDQAKLSIEGVKQAADDSKKLECLAVALGYFSQLTKLTDLSSSFSPISFI
jgi:hypothetical protein